MTVVLEKPLTLEQVADLMSCSVKTVRRAIDAGELEAFRLATRGSRGDLRVRPEALPEWMDRKSTRRERPLAAVPRPIDAIQPAAARGPRRGGTGRLIVTPDMGRRRDAA